ncbi:MAG TPA: polyphosphate kinase 1 [Gaiellaceae bacterium]|nr:polyphosphate kinase 1 [Gaiellaceae bacterium]
MATAAPPRPAPPRIDERYGNRELSWLDFDTRVLELAADRGLPLLERVKLCGIVSSNLDEFFAVRVAGLERQVASEITRRSPDGRTPAETLTAVRGRARELQAAQDALYLDELRPALDAAGIRIVGVDACRPRELRAVEKRFQREVLPLLTPSAVGAASPFPYVPSLAVSVAALAYEPAADAVHFVRVNVPDVLPRFLAVGGSGALVPLEEVVAHFLPQLFGGAEILAQTPFRVTRDADFAVSSDADDLLEAIETELDRRRFGEIVRLELARAAAPELVDRLRESLGVGEDAVHPADALVGLAALRGLADLDRPELKTAPWLGVTQRGFQKRTPADLLARIRRRDLLGHHPYDAFTTTVQPFVAAARDPRCAALKATIYRTEYPSPTLESLVEAAEAGKQSLALVELKARFDERRNIEWSRTLERAGVQVVYGTPDLKVHAKLTLLVRQERDGIRRFVHVGTGNYHASNASTYEDLSLFTADEEIAADVAEVFAAVAGLGHPKPFRKLLVGPWFLREGILREIDRVARAAHGAEAARIRIKVNSLADPGIVDALYAASQAGARIEIVTRGICTLRPGVEGLSENVTVRSVLGRFLEHSRIYSFQAGESVSTWIGSADLLPRNLDRRVEVLAPVEDSRLRAELGWILDVLLTDTSASWELDGEGTWHRVAADGRPVSAQELLMKRAAKRAKKRR